MVILMGFTTEKSFLDTSPYEMNATPSRTAQNDTIGKLSVLANSDRFFRPKKRYPQNDREVFFLFCKDYITKFKQISKISIDSGLCLI